MKYMLHTDTVSYALRGVGRVAEKIRSRLPSEISVSAVTVAELRFGTYRRRSRKLARLVGAFLADVCIEAFDESAADSYGKLAVDLLQRGTPIGQSDTMIAAHALCLGRTLVTDNETHFRRVRRLRVENWV